MAWSDDQIEMLRRLWKEGLSSTEISRRINAAYETDYTRNAIIGKRSRLHMPERSQAPSRHAGRAPKPAARRLTQNGLVNIYRAKSTLPRIPEIASAYDNARKVAGLTALVDLGERSCRWPIGDPNDPDFGFCGLRQVPGQSYCQHHTLRSVDVPRMPRASVERRPAPTVPRAKAKDDADA